MSSLRKRLDKEGLTKGMIDFFKWNKGIVPMCCCDIRYSDPKTYERLPESLYKCDQTLKEMPLSEFKPFCLKCQEYIAKKIEEMDDEKT